MLSKKPNVKGYIRTEKQLKQAKQILTGENMEKFFKLHGNQGDYLEPYLEYIMLTEESKKKHLQKAGFYNY